MNLGPLEIGGILLLFVLLFGAKKLPDLGSSVGKSIKNFKKGLSEGGDKDKDAETAETGEDVAAETDVPPATQTSRDPH
jgi:sec-independent protein translocase protein TatA